MSRRAEMTDDGKVPCGLCKQWLYIAEYYCLPIDQDSPVRDIWWGDPITGKQYGRPKSYCKKCNSATSGGKSKLRQYTSTLKLVHDVREAWLQAIEEDARRYPAETELMAMFRKVYES